MADLFSERIEPSARVIEPFAKPNADDSKKQRRRPPPPEPKSEEEEIEAPHHEVDRLA